MPPTSPDPRLTASLGHLESSLKTIFLFLTAFPPALSLGSMAVVNLVPLPAAPLDTESSIPQLGQALLEAWRRKPGG